MQHDDAIAAEKLAESYARVFDRICANKDDYFTEQEVDSVKYIRSHHMITGGREGYFGVMLSADKDKYVFGAHAAEIKGAGNCLDWIAGHEIKHAIVHYNRNCMNKKMQHFILEWCDILWLSSLDGQMPKENPSAMIEVVPAQPNFINKTLIRTKAAVGNAVKWVTYLPLKNAQSRKEEFACDAFGLKVAPETGIDDIFDYFSTPRKKVFPDNYYELSKWQKRRDAFWSDICPAIVRTHPESEKRCDRLRLLKENQADWAYTGKPLSLEQLFVSFIHGHSI